MRSSVFVAAATCFAVCLAAPTADSHSFVLHEKRDGAPHQWTKRSRAHAEEILPVRIGLVQSNLHRAEEYILDVSDPTSPNFGMIPMEEHFSARTDVRSGKHWSSEKVANVFAPAKKTAEGVADWLTKSGIEASRHTYSTGT